MSNMEWTQPASPASAPRPTSAAVDQERFRTLYYQSLPHVYGYLLHRLGGNVSLAEELTQDTYLAAVREVRRGANQDALSVPWLIGVARHKLVDHFRRLGREERKLARVAGERGQDQSWQWWDMAVDQLLASLGTLPALQRAAIGLRHLDDLPVAEVARLLGRSVHATESLLARGRDALRRHYVEHVDD